MLPADITKLITLGPPTLSPDGLRAVVAVTGADLEADEYRSSLWSVELAAPTSPRPLTYGLHDTAPRFSPDGAWLAFLRRAAHDKPQLHVMRAGGGDVRCLTELPGGAGEPVWAPGSDAVAFCARVPEQGRYALRDGADAGKEPPRRITGLRYRTDGVGFTGDQPIQLFALELPDEPAPATPARAVEPVQLTDADDDVLDVCWSPDGAQLAVVTARHAGRADDRFTDVFLLPRAGGELRLLTDTSLRLDTVRFSADGGTVLAIGSAPDGAGAGWLAQQNGLFAIEPAKPGPPRRLTDPETQHLVDGVLVAEGDHALVLTQHRGAVDVLAVGLDGSVAVRSAGQRQVQGLDAAGGRLVATFADATTAGELGRLDGADLVALTDFGSGVRDDLLPLHELDATAPDGHPVHGWLAVPPGAGPHPVLLLIHGGPFTQYGWTLLDEVQVYARAGYAVVFGNPRGSSGYGRAHGIHIRGDVGQRQAPDLLALLDHALLRPELDERRVGVLGGSHGGFMTTWLVGHTDRFGAAVSERAVNAIDSFEGSSDIGWDFADGVYGSDPEQRRRQSPLTHADAIDTPLLIIHSEQDWRCPVEQAQRLYVALRKRRATVELLLFPAEGHELSRSGLPSHRTARFDAILEWFDRHLSSPAAPRPAAASVVA